MNTNNLNIFYEKDNIYFNYRYYIYTDEIKKKLKNKKNKITYSCFILTNDNSLILCNRAYSFCFSYILCVVYKKKKIFINTIKVCIMNMYIFELISFIYVLIEKELLEKERFEKSYSLLEKELKKIDYKYLKELEKYDFTHLNQYNYLDEIIKTISEKAISMKNNNIYENDIYENNPSMIILPGGKKDKKDLNIFQVIKRELYEELNIDLNTTSSKYLNPCFKLETLNEDTKIKIKFYCLIHDKLLKHDFHNYLVFIKLDKSFDEIYKEFKSNFEIKSLINVNLNIDLNNITENTIKNTIETFCNFI